LLETARLRAHPLVKLLLFAGTLLVAGSVGWLILMNPPLLVAKLFLIACMTVGGFASLIIAANCHRWYASLHTIQQDCELASNLAFLQGEMTRAQLEALSARLKQAVEPEEREITHTMLKSISPFVLLFIRKEKNVLQWSLAAAKLGKDLLGYFWSPRHEPDS
jgi:hypothetical protein